MRRLDKVVVELTHEGIEPSPILIDGFQDDRAAMTPDTHLFAAKAKVLWKADRLRPSGPEQFCRFHTHRLFDAIDIYQELCAAM